MKRALYLISSARLNYARTTSDVRAIQVVGNYLLSRKNESVRLMKLLLLFQCLMTVSTSSDVFKKPPSGFNETVRTMKGELRGGCTAVLGASPSQIPFHCPDSFIVAMAHTPRILSLISRTSL